MPANTRKPRAGKPEAVRRMAEAQRLIGGKKTRVFSARLDEALLKAAKARSGI